MTSIERTIRTEYTTTSTTPSETVFIRTTATNYRQLTTLSFATDMEKSIILFFGIFVGNLKKFHGVVW